MERVMLTAHTPGAKVKTNATAITVTKHAKEPFFIVASVLWNLGEIGKLDDKTATSGPKSNLLETNGTFADFKEKNVTIAYKRMSCEECFATNLVRLMILPT